VTARVASAELSAAAARVTSSLTAPTSTLAVHEAQQAHEDLALAKGSGDPSAEQLAERSYEALLAELSVEEAAAKDRAATRAFSFCGPAHGGPRHRLRTAPAGRGHALPPTVAEQRSRAPQAPAT